MVVEGRSCLQLMIMGAISDSSLSMNSLSLAVNITWNNWIVAGQNAFGISINVMATGVSLILRHLYAWLITVVLNKVIEDAV